MERKVETYALYYSRENKVLLILLLTMYICTCGDRIFTMKETTQQSVFERLTVSIDIFRSEYFGKLTECNISGKLS